MNRQEAAVYVWETYEWCMREYENARADKGMMSKTKEAFDVAIAALNEVGSTTTQLDENGLMPCGCGGKAHVYMPVSVYALYIIGCERCRVRITFPNKVNEAKNEWNAAMGWRADK